MLYYYFFNMLKVGVPGFTQTPQLLVLNLFFQFVYSIPYFFILRHSVVVLMPSSFAASRLSP